MFPYRRLQLAKPYETNLRSARNANHVRKYYLFFLFSTELNPCSSETGHGIRNSVSRLLFIRRLHFGTIPSITIGSDATQIPSKNIISGRKLSSRPVSSHSATLRFVRAIFIPPETTTSTPASPETFAAGEHASQICNWKPEFRFRPKREQFVDREPIRLP